MIRFNVNVDLADLDEKFDKILKKAQFILDEQVIKDSNFYAPEDIGTLQKSSLTASSIGEGRVVWNTAYARRLYYNPEYNFSKDKNPNAGGLWFEKAKANHKGDWVKIIQKFIDENV